MSQEELASADSFVVLFACPFKLQEPALFTTIFGEYWQEDLQTEIEALESTDGEFSQYGTGVFTFQDGVTAKLHIEEPIPQLVQLTGRSPVPFSATEIVLLKDHASIWRFSIESGGKKSRRAAKRMSQLMVTMIESGAIAAFLPALGTLHAPRMIRQETMDVFSPQSTTQLFIGAFHHEGWMRTRGLTAFGMPEVEIRMTEGANAAFFHLMDVAANMILQMSAYPPDSKLTIGPKTFRIVRADDDVEPDPIPVNGAFGVLRLTPAPKVI